VSNYDNHIIDDGKHMTRERYSHHYYATLPRWPR